MNGSLFCNKCGAPNDASAQFCSRCGTTLNPVSAAAGAGPPGFGQIPPVGYPAPPTYPGVVAGVSYGGFWVRVVAAIIDAILIRIAVVPIAAVIGLGGLGIAFGDPGLGLMHSHRLAMLILCASWLYEALMESSSYQATLGKMIFRMKVTDLYGNRISFARATGRHFAKILSGFILINRLHYGRLHRA